MKHVLRAQDFDVSVLMRLFERTQELIELPTLNIPRDISGQFKGLTMALLFYEPSTRTRFSFSFAALRLGMSIVATENAAEFSSASKGETLEDTVRVISEYGPDVIVIRHKEAGSAERAAKVADPYGVSIINAGDGAGQHPTQALLDIFTIHRLLGRTANLRVTIGGDLLMGRTARSLAYMLGKVPGQ